MLRYIFARIDRDSELFVFAYVFTMVSDNLSVGVAYAHAHYVLHFII